MKRNQTMEFGVLGAQIAFGTIALTLATLISFRLHGDFATTAFIYLVVILLSSLLGSFAASVLLWALSVGALAYFFAPPIHQFWIDDPKDVLVMAAFFLTSVIVAYVIRTARKEREVAIEAEARLRRGQVEIRNSERDWREVFEHNPVMYFMVDAAGRVLNVNAMGERRGSPNHSHF